MPDQRHHSDASPFVDGGDGAVVPQRRAEVAMKYLIAQGVHPSRIALLSYGEERPLCTEASERCWSQNRRSRFPVKPRS